MKIRKGDICSYINAKGKMIISTVIEVDIELRFKHLSFGNEFCYVKTKNGRIIMKGYDELTKIKDVRFEKMMNIIK